MPCGLQDAGSMPKDLVIGVFFLELGCLAPKFQVFGPEFRCSAQNGGTPIFHPPPHPSCHAHLQGLLTWTLLQTADRAQCSRMRPLECRVPPT